MLIRRAEKLSHLRLHTQYIEIIAGDLVAGDLQLGLTPNQFRTRICINADHPAEGGVALPKIIKRRIRRGQRVPAHPLLMANLIKARWVAHSQRMQQDGVDYSADDDVYSNPQHQSE